jgi:hypothetical protein
MFLVSMACLVFYQKYIHVMRREKEAQDSVMTKEDM